MNSPTKAAPLGPLCLLEARRISRFASDGTRLLSGVSVHLNAGESLAIAGPSGAGKSLLLRALAQLDDVEEGEILWRGKLVGSKQIPQFRSRVIYVPQRVSLPEGTVRDAMRIPFAFHANRQRNFRQENAVESLGRLNREVKFLEKSTTELSGGETQIVTLLTALQLDPEVLLLDEPTSAMDESTTLQMESLLTDWLRPPEIPGNSDGGRSPSAASQRAMILVTHMPAQMTRLTGRTIYIERGRLI